MYNYCVCFHTYLSLSLYVPLQELRLVKETMLHSVPLPEAYTSGWQARLDFSAVEPLTCETWWGAYAGGF